MDEYLVCFTDETGSDWETCETEQDAENLAQTLLDEGATKVWICEVQVVLERPAHAL